MTTLLEQLGDWYLDGIKVMGTDPAVDPGRIAADQFVELLHRLATAPNLPQDWPDQLSKLAGPHTVALVAKMQEAPSLEHRFQLLQEVSGEPIEGEAHKLLGTIDQHVLNRGGHTPAISKILLAVHKWLADRARALPDNILGGILSSLILEQAKARRTSPSSAHDQARPAPEHRLQQEPEAHGLADLDLAVHFLSPPKPSNPDQWRATIYCAGKDVSSIDEITYTSAVQNLSRKYRPDRSTFKDVTQFCKLGSSTNAQNGFRVDFMLEHTRGVNKINILFMKIVINEKQKFTAVSFSCDRDTMPNKWRVGNLRLPSNNTLFGINIEEIPFMTSS